jgi:hypothetical protein
MAAKKKSKAAKKAGTRSKVPAKARPAGKGKPAAKKAAPKKAAPKKAAPRKAAPKKAASRSVAQAAKKKKSSGDTQPTVKRKVTPSQPTVTPRERMERLATPVVSPVEAMERAARNTLGNSAVRNGPSPAPAATPEPAAAASEDDRREFLRVPYGAWVNVVRDGRQEFCLARDISLGGLFLKASPPPALGQDIQLLLVIENDTTPLELRGVVVRRSESEGGFGVRFQQLDPLTSRRLRELVADTSAALWRPPSGSPTSAP